MSTANKAIVQKVNEAFIKGDTNAFLGYCKDDVTWNMLGDRVIKGKEAILKYCGTPIEPPAFTVNDTIAEGDLVVSNGDMIMKNNDGVPQEYGYCDVYKFSDGKIEELTSYVVKKVSVDNTANS